MSDTEKSDYKSQASLGEASAKKYPNIHELGGFIMDPSGVILPVEPGSTLFDSVKKYSGNIVSVYQYAYDLLAPYHDQGSIPDEAYDELLDLLLSKGWVQAHSGEVVSRRFDNTYVRNIGDALSDTAWPNDALIQYIDADTFKPIAYGSVAEFKAAKTTKHIEDITQGYTTGKSKIQESQAPVSILEARSYKQLMRGSESGRRGRARTVKTRPPEVYYDTEGNEVLKFNFKAFPSTTGKRQKGYALFRIPPDQLEKNYDAKLGNFDCEISCSCFTGDARVLMANGATKAIKDVLVGDLVISHTGVPRRVSAVDKHVTRKAIHRVDVVGMLAPLYVTSDHRFLVYRGNDECLCGCGTQFSQGYTTDKRSEPHNRSGRLSQKFAQGHHRREQMLEDKSSTLQWHAVEDLWDYDSAFMPKPRFDETEYLDDDTAFILGLYLAEGSVKKHSVSFSLSVKESDLDSEIRKMVECHPDLVTSVRTQMHEGKRGNSWRSVHVNGKKFSSYLSSWFSGRSASSKVMASKIMNLNESAKLHIIAGMIAGDGHINKSGRIGYVTKSRCLHDQLRVLLLSVGIRCTSCPDTQSSSGFRNEKPGYVLRVVPKQGKEVDVLDIIKDRAPLKRNITTANYDRPWINHDIIDEGFLYTVSDNTIVSPEGHQDTTVYDITVDVDSSFIVNGIAVHNCPDYLYRWEVANARVGSSKIIHSNGQPPNVTNPTMRPGLCKHLLALAPYVGTVSVSDEWLRSGDSGEKDSKEDPSDAEDVTTDDTSDSPEET